MTDSKSFLETGGMFNYKNADEKTEDSRYSMYSEYYNNISTPEKKSAPPPPPIPMDIIKRELLVFVVYYNVGNHSEVKTQTKLGEVRAGLYHTFEDVEKYTNYLIKFLIFPIKEGETRMECIFPKNQDNVDLSSLVDLSEEKVKGFTVGDKIEKEDKPERVDHRSEAIIKQMRKYRKS